MTSGAVKDPDNVVSLDEHRDAQLGIVRKRRRVGKDFPDPVPGSVPYADSRPELARLTRGQKAALIMSSAAWADIAVPILAQVEAERPTCGPEPSYTTEELERAVL